MRNFAADALASLDGHSIVCMGMVHFAFDSGDVGFWDGDADFLYNGVTFRPGKPLRVGSIEASYGLEAQGLEISLSTLNVPGLTPDILASIEQESYIGKQINLYLAYYTPGGILLSVERVWRGYIDGFDHRDAENGESELVCRAESKGMDTFKRGHRLRSPADQVLVSVGDKGLEYVGTVGKTDLFWGRNPDKVAK